MTTKNFLAVLATILTLVLITCLIFVSYQMFLTTRPISSINITRTESKKVDVEKAVLRVYFSFSGSNINDLNTQASQKMQAVEEFLKSQSINENDVKKNRNAYTDYYDQRNQSPSDKAIQRLETSVEIEFKNIKEDTEKPANVFDGLVKLEPARFDNWDYKFGSNTQDLCRELGNQAFQKAIEEAKAKVTMLNGSIVSTESISNENNCANEFGFVRPMPAVSLARDSQAPDAVVTKFNPGQMEISVTVDLRMNYRLANLW